MSGVHHIVLGEASHGVTRLGRALVPAGERPTILPALRSVADAAAAARRLPAVAQAPAIHLHASDGLLGDDAAGALHALAAGRRLAMTLHDVPQPNEGAERFARRSRLYAELCQIAELVVVCSQHERTALERLVRGTATAVVDHPIDAIPHGLSPAANRTVGVLGWLHPGKGHADVLRSMATAVPGGTLVALGAPGPGHASLVDELGVLAASLGIALEVTGYLREADLLARAAAVSVPVCAHRHVSASGTLGTWMTAGRVPVVRDGHYAREVAARCPGALTLAEELAPAMSAALAAPATTLLPGGARVGPSTAEAAARQHAVLRGWAAAR